MLPNWIFLESSGFSGATKVAASSLLISDRFMMELPETVQVNGGDCPRRLSPNCLQLGLTLPCLSLRCRNMNLLLFRFHRVAVNLSPTHPGLITSAQEPLSIRPSGFSPDLRSILPQRFTLPLDPARLTPGLPFSRHARLLHTSPLLGSGCGVEIGTQLRYGYFRGLVPRRVRG